jgi:hypothetical protein
LPDAAGPAFFHRPGGETANRENLYAKTRGTIMAMRKTVENKEIKHHAPIEERSVGKPRKSDARANLILADDENGERPNPVDAPNAPKHTSTDRASRSPHSSTVTDGEAG